MKLVYSPKYEVDVGRHVFNMAKYRLVKERLTGSGVFDADDIVEPEPADDADILLVHTPDYVRKLKTGSMSLEELQTLEIAFSPQLVEASWLWAGGSIEAGRIALAEGACFHDGGGFHHAFPGHGEGFCAINDHAVAVRRLLKDGAIASALIVDCDVHQANGTATIFARDPAVVTLSIHQQSIYPYIKPASDIDIGLDDWTGDERYNEELAAGLDYALSSMTPDLIFYVAGADTFEGDTIGGLNLSIEGLKRRDLLVCEKARSRGIPVAAVLAGGYASEIDDLVTIHANTALVMSDILMGA